ncbi:MAG: hypothetical protein M1837_006195 [Sclerophora amabilis]|nr:MAG: hypothetical protein M1837_006195 [Sclerophora amabilis]
MYSSEELDKERVENDCDISGNDETFSESALREMAKSMSDRFSEENLPISRQAKVLENDLERLITTAGIPGISATHRTAACNALCAFLEASSASPTPELRAFSRDETVWGQVLDLYLDWFNSAKTKFLRQVLSTLSALLSRNGERPATRRFLERSVRKLLAVILQKGTNSRIKASLQALELLLSKELITTKDFVSLVQSQVNEFPLPNVQLWPHEKVEGLDGLPEAELAKDTSTIKIRPDIFDSGVISSFVFSILELILYSDIASAAGKFLTTFFRKLRSCLDAFHSYTQYLAQPLWALPILECIRRHPEALEDFKLLVFPGVFQLNTKDTLQFLNSLGLESVITQQYIGDDDIHNMLLFSAIQVAKELRIIRETDDRKATGGCTEDSVTIPVSVFEPFLTHHSSVMRCSVLSFLVTSPSNAKPFRNEVLVLLRPHLTLFPADTDAKFRNDVLSITKHILDRLRGSILYLTKAIKRFEKNPLIRSETPSVMQSSQAQCNSIDSKGEPYRLLKSDLDHHARFLDWYISFLWEELRSTATYQRHIMALKATLILLNFGLDGILLEYGLTERIQKDKAMSTSVSQCRSRMERALVDLSMDPFDDVRQTAAIILGRFPSSSFSALEFRESCSIAKLLAPSALTEEIPTSSGQYMIDFYSFLRRANDLMRLSGRADHSNGVARSYDIVFGSLVETERAKPTSNEQWSSNTSKHAVIQSLVSRLEIDISIAETSLSQAISNPVHGNLESLRIIFERDGFYPMIKGRPALERSAWSTLHRRIIEVSERLWECVSTILCDESPEGLELGDQTGLGTKDVLSYCWRALKESSLLLQSIISRAPCELGSQQTMLTVRDMKDIGNLSFKQLAELRHRGAFSTVSQTFATCCQRCAAHWDPEISSLPNRWYEETLLCIRDQASSITRRSAGIPSLITGILKSQPQSQLFRKALLDLQAESRSPTLATESRPSSGLSQVHTLNCLKDIFTNPTIESPSEPYVADALHLAASCLESKIWPIRNCGVMLFKALADRILGTSTYQSVEQSGNSNIRRIFPYDKYPTLPLLLVELLSKSQGKDLEGEISMSNISQISIETTFPALEIVWRAGPPEKHREAIKESVFRHLGSNLWQVRQMAAYAYETMLDGNDYLTEMDFLLDFSSLSHNQVHGNLLTTRILVNKIIATITSSRVQKHEETLHELNIPFENVQESVTKLAATLNNSWKTILSTGCSITIAALLETINDIFEKCFLTDDSRIPDFLSDAKPWLENYLEVKPSLSEQCSSQSRWEQEEDLSTQYTADTLLRKAAARRLCLHYLSEDDVNALQVLLTRLFQNDVEAASSALNLLRSVLRKRTARSIETTWGTAATLFELKRLNSSTKLEASVDHSLADLLQLLSWPTSEKQFDVIRESLLERLGSALQWPPSLIVGNPSAAEADLRLRGSALAAECRFYNNWPDKVRTKIRMWTCMLHEAGKETQDDSTRFGAVLSLKAFRLVFRPDHDRTNTHPFLLPLYLVLYDTLNDDDNEIRNAAASLVSWILTDPSKDRVTFSIVPPAASQKLCEWLAASYSVSTALHISAIGRLTGSQVNEPLLDSATIHICPVSETLRQARKQDTSLFVEEKHNLFVDQVSEAKIWSNVLLQLRPESHPPCTRAALSEWVEQALTVLTETAMVEIDGPLGWTSAPDVFTVGVRVISAAGVLIQWGSNTQQTETSVEKIKTGLKTLLNEGRKTHLHEMWLGRIDKILDGID